MHRWADRAHPSQLSFPVKDRVDWQHLHPTFPQWFQPVEEWAGIWNLFLLQRESRRTSGAAVYRIPDSGMPGNSRCRRVDPVARERNQSRSRNEPKDDKCPAGVSAAKEFSVPDTWD